MRTSTLQRVVLCSVGLGLSVARAAQPPPDQAMTSLNDHHRHHQHGGITQFVTMSLDTLGEAEVRRDKVDELEATLHGCMAPVEDQESAVLGLVAEGVAAGTVDLAKVKAAIEQLNAAADTIHACVALPLNELHATLSVEERAELGDKVRAHWEVWREVNHDADPASRGPGTHLGELVKDLGLTADQAGKLAAALKDAFKGQTFDAARVQKQVQDFATAFNSKTFDATSVTTHSTAYLTSQGANRMALFYQAVTPLLTAEQRTKLAAQLREHADHHPAVPGAQP